MTWRSESQKHIQRVEAECRGKSLRELKQALRDAYPFGARQYHPYKIWCDEQRKAIARHPESLKLSEQDTSELPLFSSTGKG